MNANDLKNLLDARNNYNKLFNKHVLFIEKCANDFRTKIIAVYKELYSDWKYNYDCENQWILHTDTIRINDALGSEFWQYGRCGNSDECLCTIFLTEDLLTEEGRLKMTNEWIAKEKIKIEANKKKDDTKKQQEIARLEAQLLELKQS